jgi:hypothetical protein
MVCWRRQQTQPLLRDGGDGLDLMLRPATLCAMIDYPGGARLDPADATRWSSVADHKIAESETPNRRQRHRTPVDLR